MEYEYIKYIPGTVSRVILNRPERHNAQSWALLLEMDDAFNRAMADEDCRIVVLSGAGKSFSAGHDSDSPEQVEGRRRHLAEAGPFVRTQVTRDIYLDSHLRWRDLPKPTVAMVHGWCIFGGWMIASAMDFIFAADDALFIPVYGDYFTAHWDLGPRKAKEVLFENRFMTSQEAMEWGFVNRVYPSELLEEETARYAERVAEHDPFTTRMIKFAINQAMDMQGFTTSAREVGLSFMRQPQPGANEPGERPRENSPLRAMVERARKYLAEDTASPFPGKR